MDPKTEVVHRRSRVPCCGYTGAIKGFDAEVTGANPRLKWITLRVRLKIDLRRAGLEACHTKEQLWQ